MEILHSLHMHDDGISQRIRGLKNTSSLMVLLSTSSSLSQTYHLFNIGNIGSPIGVSVLLVGLEIDKEISDSNSAVPSRSSDNT